mmetsp:Transcript_77349/g.250268  ORF Transcript_77349/g.250268 Transcript_77349/m.250268 type:complete len:250 (+) Transcript_77349:298-1047(+)
MAPENFSAPLGLEMSLSLTDVRHLGRPLHHEALLAEVLPLELRERLPRRPACSPRLLLSFSLWLLSSLQRFLHSSRFLFSSLFAAFASPSLASGSCSSSCSGIPWGSSFLISSSWRCRRASAAGPAMAALGRAPAPAAAASRFAAKPDVFGTSPEGLITFGMGTKGFATALFAALSDLEVLAAARKLFRSGFSVISSQARRRRACSSESCNSSRSAAASGSCWLGEPPASSDFGRPGGTSAGLPSLAAG